ncbi:hypothetical protein V8D89_000985 [Ganoderma adspersum]
MVTIALKSEALFAIIGVGSVFVIVCVAAALCYTCQRRSRKSKGKAGGKQGEITEELPARKRSRRNADGHAHAEEGVPKEMVPPVEETKREASAPSSRLKPPAVPPKSTPPPAQPRVSQSARLDPRLSQQMFSTFESFYRAQSETTRSVPPSPHSPSGAWPSQPTARRTSTSSRRASRDTNAALADIALPSSPTTRKLSMTGAWTGASQKPDRASLPTSAPPQRSRPLWRMPDIVIPPAAASPRSKAFSAKEAPQSPLPFPTASARRSPASGSALASRPRSRSVGSSTVPPPGHRELRRVGQKQVHSVARSRSAVSRSLDGGSRPVRGPPSQPLTAPSRSTSASNAPRPSHIGRGQPRSYFDD